MKKIILGLLIIWILGASVFFLFPRKTDVSFVVLPHHNLSNKALLNEYSQIAETRKFDNIVIISPNHFWVWDQYFQSFENNWKYCFQLFCVKGKRFENYTQNDVTFNFSETIGKNQYKIYEHGIWTHFEYINKFFPKAAVYSAIIQREFEDFSNANKVTTFLEQQKFSGNTLFIASVDFSHHVEENFAKIHDQKTLQSLKYGNFKNLEVDCASCLYVLKKLATNQGKPYFQLHNRTSVDSILNKNTDKDNTSHLFWEYYSTEKEDEYFILDDYLSVPLKGKSWTGSSVTGVFFWDTNFSDRWYHEIVRRNKASPEELLNIFGQENNAEKFGKKAIHKKLHWFDFVNINFESSVYEKPTECEYSQKSTIIKTKEKYLKYFREMWVTHVSLANNHSYDCWNIGFQATKKHMKNNNILYYWEWRWTESNILKQEIQWKKIAFVWFNDTTYFTNWEKKYQIISNLKKEDYFVIVNVHWGVEYQKQNNARQRKLAEKLVVAWSDLIIWHHPHVTQNYEVIHNVPVFYSLWNFHFDQPMEDTLKWMGVFFELWNSELKVKPIYLYRDNLFMKIQKFGDEKKTD